ncbi:MAG: hypothetical protein SFU27_10655 [Thermonemataceae bacterium]|nr:hypothetical protein [Thermonemataceae bacterium]
MHIGTYSNNIAFYLHCLDRNEEALTEIQKAILYDKENTLFYHKQAEILFTLQLKREALANIEKPIELEDSEDKQILKIEILKQINLQKN